MTDATTRTSEPSGASAVSPAADDATIGGLVHRLTEQIPELVRTEMRLAQTELTQKGKKAGVGLGMFSAAGLLAFFGLATLIATAVLALAEVLPAWAAALMVAVVLFVGAAIVGLLGKKEVEQATPATPERTVSNVRQDVAAVKGGHG